MKFRNLKQAIRFTINYFLGSTGFKYLNRDGEIVDYKYKTDSKKVLFTIICLSIIFALI